MSKADNVAKLAPADVPFFVSEIFAPHIHHFFKAQEKALLEADTFAKRWFDRRQKATTTAMKTAAQLTSEAPGMETTQSVLRDLQMQSLECLAEDANDWLALWRDCANVFATGEIDAEIEVMEAASKGKGARKLPTRIPV